MKECASCHNQVEDAAATCPRCRHAFGPTGAALQGREQAELATAVRDLVREVVELKNALPQQQPIHVIQNIIKGSFNDIGDKTYGERGAGVLKGPEIQVGTDRPWANKEAEKHAQGDALRAAHLGELYGEADREWKEEVLRRLQGFGEQFMQRIDRASQLSQMVGQQLGAEHPAPEALERERAAREAAERERAAREAAERERLAREVEERERAARQLAERERAARQAVERERALQVAREATERERAAREQAARQRVAREQEERERAAREQAERQRAAQEAAERERVALEVAADDARLRAATERIQRERQRAAREQAERERAAPELAEREREAQEAWERGVREQAAYERAVRKRAARRRKTPPVVLLVRGLLVLIIALEVFWAQHQYRAKAAADEASRVAKVSLEREQRHLTAERGPVEGLQSQLNQLQQQRDAKEQAFKEATGGRVDWHNAIATLLAVEAPEVTFESVAVQEGGKIVLKGVTYEAEAMATLPGKFRNASNILDFQTIRWEAENPAARGNPAAKTGPILKFTATFAVRR